MSIESSAGNFQALSNHGTTPNPFQLVIFSIELYPSSNKLVSPLNLLIKKPFTISLSTESKTALVPTICAITPPRSISPHNTTGTSASTAKPIFAISPSRKFISAGLPAPSTMTKSFFSFNELNEVKTCFINFGFS